MFEKAICLCLDKRKEHWQQLVEEGKGVGLEIETFICGDGSDPELVYNQIDVVNPDISQWGYGVAGLKHHHYNALLAQKNIIQLAKDRGLKSVLILEDDIYICSRWLDVMDKIKEDPPDPRDWLLFYFGWWKGDEEDEFNLSAEKEYYENGNIQYVMADNKIGGFHSVIVKEELYDLILSLPFTNPLDSQINEMRQFIPSLLLLPKVTQVKSIYSNTEGQILQRKVL